MEHLMSFSSYLFLLNIYYTLQAALSGAYMLSKS